MKKILLNNCRVLDVIAKKVVDGQSILIEDGLIKEVGKTDEVAPNKENLGETDVYELGNKLVMPGLIDCHVHLCVVRNPKESDIVLQNLRATETLKVLYGAKNAKVTLEAGFTTVRDVGQGDNVALRDAIEQGAVPGPRVVACGWVGPTGGHQERMSSEWVYDIPMRDNEVGVDGPWGVRKKVRELVRQGVDCIKSYTTGEGLYKYPLYPYWSDMRNYTDEELNALVDEAHSSGRKVAVHAFVDNIGIKSAIRAGVDSIEHGVFIEEKDTLQMNEKGIYYTPTLGVGITIFEAAAAKGMARMWAVEEGLEKKYPIEHAASFKRAYENKVKIVCGSDTYRILQHGENAFELEAMVRCGMSEMDALTAGTYVSAELLGLERFIGSVEEGKYADLLVVSSDPLSDITSLRDKSNLKMIMKKGDIFSSQL